MTRFVLAFFLLSCCVHRVPLTIITTRQNGTIKVCGEVDPSAKVVSGRSPEGTKVMVNSADIVTTEERGTCKR